MAKVDSNLGVNLGIMNCSECEKFNIGIKLYESINWASTRKIIAFDKDTSEIIVDEQGLMRMIQMVNQAQTTRSIRLKGGEKD